MLTDRVVFCAVTGGSRGIGRCVAQSIASKCAPGSQIVLIARDKQRLADAKQNIENSCPSVSVCTESLELSGNVSAEYYEQLLQTSKTEMKSSPDVALLVQNSGSLGPIDQKASELRDIKMISAYMDENFGSFVLLNSAFLKVFPANSVSVRTVVNVSSGASVAYHPCFHLYGAGKAARDQFYRSLSNEEPDLRVLSYNPGATATDMQYDVGKMSWSEKLREWSLGT